MQLTIRGRKTAPTEREEQHAQKRIVRLQKLIAGEHPVSLILGAERGFHIAELNVVSDGLFVRSSSKSGDALAVIDDVVDKVEKQLLRYRRRKEQDRHRLQAGAEPVAAHTEEDQLPHIVRTKRYSIKPMSSEEAIQQMELVDHAFFMFVNSATGQTNVVYRREDGNYGRIEPDA